MDIFRKKPISIIDGVYNFIETVDEYIENYDTISRDDRKKAFTPSEVKQVLLNLCEIAIGNQSVDNLVDIGCGDGFIISSISANKKIAVDIAIEYLKNIHPSITRVRCNSEHLPFVSSFSDIVICTDVFEHVQNETYLSNEIDRILKPAGKLLLAVPWEQDLSIYQSEEYRNNFKQYKYVHLRSVNDQLIKENFGNNFKIMASTMLTIGMKYMKLKPYPIRFIVLQKKGE